MKSLYELVAPYDSVSLIGMCKNAGKPACNGLKMLLYQGVAAYELWNDVSVTKEQADKVYNKMKEELGIE